MKPEVYKFFIEAYLKKFFPYKYDKKQFTFNLIPDVKISLEFLEWTTKLIDFYAKKVDGDSPEEVNEVINLIFRFIDIGHSRDNRGAYNLYYTFTSQNMQKSSRKYFEASPTLLKIVRRKEVIKK